MPENGATHLVGIKGLEQALLFMHLLFF